MRRLALTATALVTLMGSVAVAQGLSEAAIAPPIRLNLDLPAFESSGAPKLDLRETDRRWQPADELSWRFGALGAGFREENGRIKGGVFLERSGWQLGVRPLGGDNVIDANGIKLRLSTKFGD